MKAEQLTFEGFEPVMMEVIDPKDIEIKRKAELACERLQRQEDDYNDYLLEKMLECNCPDVPDFKHKKKDKICEEFYIENLPAVDFVAEQIVNYLFADGITTGKAEDKEKLNDFLYRQNLQGASNLEVLKATIKKTKKYGECGLRLYDGCLYTVPKEQYAPLIYRENGVKRIVCWLVSTKGYKVTGLELDEDTNSLAEILRQLNTKDLALIDASEFVNIRDNTEDIRSESPFERDKFRTAQMIGVWEQLNYDIRYDGTGRIVLRPKSGFEATGREGVDTATVINNTMPAQISRAEKAMKEAERVARQFKGSSSSDVLVVSPAFDKDITHLPRVTKSTEFLDWTDNNVKIVAQVMGIDPAMIGASPEQNYSMEHIIDNGMLNSIIPMREKFAVQFSKMISDFIGVEKVYFDKYKMKQTETITDKVEKYTNMMYKILVGTKDVDSGENVDELRTTVKIINDLIQKSLTEDNGEVKRIEEV